MANADDGYLPKVDVVGSNPISRFGRTGALATPWVVKL